MIKKNLNTFILGASIVITLVSVFLMQGYVRNIMKMQSEQNEAARVLYQNKIQDAEKNKDKEIAITQLVLDAYIAEYDTHANTRNAELRAYAVATPEQQIELKEQIRTRERQIAERITRKIYQNTASPTDIVPLINIVQLIGEMYITEIYVQKEMHQENLKEYAAAPHEGKDDLDYFRYDKEIQRVHVIYSAVSSEFSCWWQQCAFNTEYNTSPLFSKIQQQREAMTANKKYRAEQLLSYKTSYGVDPYAKASAVERYAELEIRKIGQEKYDAASPAEKLHIDQERLDREKGASERINRKINSIYCDGDAECIAAQKTYAAATFEQRIQLEKKRRLREREKLKQTL